MEDDQLLRYSRQIMLPDVDIAGQERLRAARVLVVGIGGLGSPVALYLAAAGVGQLTLCDDDKVDLSNLQRQIAHTTASIGENKAVSAKVRLAALNPDVDIQVIDQRLDAPGLTALLANVDLVMDCTDNFDSRYVINDICWHAGVPVVSGAAIRWEGQISLFDPAVEGAPCYRCLYPSGPSADDGALSCSENGVIAPLVGIIGTSQALEALKYLMGVGDSLAGYVLYLDSKFSEWRKLKLSPRPGCPTCGD
jgi:molybdopterin/thiamine biosynthesis adenylyltransferase